MDRTTVDKFKLAVEIQAHRTAVWYPFARHGTGPRTMPQQFESWQAVAGQVRALPQKRVFLSEPFGQSGLGGAYRFDEFARAMVSGDGKRYVAGFVEAMSNLAMDDGKTVVLYMGRPATLDDAKLLDLHFAMFDRIPGIEYAFDGSSGEVPGSLCERVIQHHGRHRFWIEAWPWKTQEHWAGMRVMMVDLIYRHVQGQLDNYMPRSVFGDIAVMFTGHDGNSETDDVRLSRSVAADGGIIGWQPWSHDRWSRAWHVTEEARRA